MNKKQKITTCIGLIITLLFVSVGVMVGDASYNWELQKCSELKSPSYEFTHDVQLNAEYSANCYRYQNHPMAYTTELFEYFTLALLLSVFMWIAVFLLNAILCDEYFSF